MKKIERNPKSIKLLVGLMLFVFFCDAQIYFNKRIDMYNRANLAYSITKDGNHYYIHGEANDSLTTIEKSSIFLIDSVGNVLFKKAFNPDTTSLYYPSYYASSILSNGKLVTPITVSSLTGNENGGILQRNLNGDTIKYITFGDTSHFLETAKLIKNGKEWLFAANESNSKYGSYHYKMKLLNFDSLFNIKWSNTYGLSGYNNYCTDFLRCSNGDCFLIGFQTGSSTAQQKTMLVKTDSVGNQKWIKYYSNIWYVGPTISLLSDGNLLISTTYLDSTSFNFSLKYTQTNLIKIDTGGNVIWNKLYQYPANYNFASKCIELCDKSLIVIGTEGGLSGSSCSPQKQSAFIMKTDSMGSEIFYHTYTGDAMDITSYNYLYDIIQMPDKGFLATGVVAPNCDGTTWDAWILRVDSAGCESSGNCPAFTGLQTNSSLDNSFNAYPNPTTGDILINYNIEKTSNEEYTILLTELYSGKVLIKKTCYSNVQQLNLDISEFSNGVYALTICNSKNVIKTIKIVKL